MSRIRKIIITIDCQPKEGKEDMLFAAFWKAIEKHTTRKQPRSIQTSYIYEGRGE
ncbi:hypothetical protein [Paenarthrobacter nitroguajacolicus]|uniref:hypothetical protein n=1 Tax=Paenarthrobacter nitroguajacolicus TaxID=211146 RepID=UPI0015BF6E58|nr:hypothetical protein [Paenarthrobacter nitroguajacolicus]